MIKLVELEKSFSLILILLCLGKYAESQVSQHPANFDTIYDFNIQTIIFNNSKSVTGFPIIALESIKSTGVKPALFLSFDDLTGQTKRYRYDVVHVNKDWQEEGLNEYDFLNGLNRTAITNFELSTNRNQNYTHYFFQIPNKDVKFKISGNYLLHVYEEIKGKKNYILTRRFMVVDEKIQVIGKQNNTSEYGEDANQEIYIELNTKGFPIYQPKNELFVTVVQNRNWGNSMSNITFNRDKPDLFIYDYVKKINFKAGKEFRNLDIRNLRFRNRYVQKINEYTDETVLTLRADNSRELINFVDEQDFQGRFLIQDLRTVNNNFDTAEINRIENSPDFALQSSTSCEYIWADFKLKINELVGDSVYVVGEFSEWKCLPENKMKYDLELQSYIGSVYLKQGYYNYLYAIKDKNGKPNSSPIEGDWNETRNEYQVLAYYRPFGARYDQLIGYNEISTFDLWRVRRK